MEGKTGINLVLTLIAIVLVIAGVALCVLFGIKQPLPGDIPLSANLSGGLAAIGLGCVMLVLTNIATNARIAADNTYDSMYRLGLIAKMLGVDDDDLAIPAKELLKAQKQEEAVQKALQAESEEEAAIAKIVAEEQAEESEQAPAEQAQEEQAAADGAPVLNWGIDVEDWKKALAGKVTCACCGATVGIHKTKKGVGVLMCPNVKKDGSGCQANPITVDKVGEQFLQWYGAFFEEQLDTVDLDKLEASVGAMRLDQEGDIHFEAK